MGQFAPDFDRGGRTRLRGSAVYLCGVAVSALLVFALADQLGVAALGGVRLSTRYFAAASLSWGLFLADAVRLWVGHSSSFGLQRQTPVKWRRKGLVGYFAWGLDTGTPFSTVRASSFPLIGFALTVLCLGDAWIGSAYLVGISSGLAIPILHWGGGTVGRIELLHARAKSVGAPIWLLSPSAVVGSGFLYVAIASLH